MDDSLEALLEKATNPKNKYEDWEFIMAFCDKVNAEAEGPLTALRIIVPKMRHENEKVSLLSLTLLEACVKNCGQRFHQELGKFRFLNELIRMVSPKYLGNQTTPAVKTKIQELLYNWKAGLPHEPKIAEAFQMLKKEGLVFDESQPPDKTLDSDTGPKPRIALVEDPKQSEVLRRLLASKNPEDLRAANRLIREMVRRDEKRMEKLQKRLEQLELISNNTKLLSELLAHYGAASGEQEKLLMKELHSSLDKMRPNLFRMASELKQNEEGMAEILQVNDSLIRVMDRYKKIMGEDDPETTASTSTTATSTTATTSASDLVTTTQSPNASSMSTGAVASAAGGSDVLIDLADLNFGATPPLSQDAANTSTSSSLLDDLGLLNISVPPQTTTPNFSSITIPPLLTSPPSQPIPMGLPSQQQLPQAQQQQQQPFPMLASALAPSSSLSSPPLITIPPPPPGAPFVPISRIMPPSSTAPTTQPGPGTAAVPSPGANLLGGLGSLTLGASPSQTQPQTQPGGPPAPSIQPLAPPGPTGLVPLSGAGAVQADPLAVLDDLFVAQENIQPGPQPPVQVMNKGGITVTFHFAKNTPAHNVAVVVISIISTCALTITNFQFQAAVPKVMRVKLQPPKGTELAPYNPILPPSSISQIMLLANPTKAKIRLKYRISYNQNGQEVVEMGEASNLPSL